MIEKFRNLFNTYYSFDTLFPGAADNTSSGEIFNNYTLGRSQQFLLRLLTLLPWLCLLGFLLSLFPYFESDKTLLLPFLNLTFPLKGLLNILSVSGLIGYTTNYLAIKMLFRPLKRRPIWGQGLIPAQRDRIIYTLAAGIHEYILNKELISTRLAQSGLMGKIAENLTGSTQDMLLDPSLRDSFRESLSKNLKEYLQQEATQKNIQVMIDKHVEERTAGVRKFFLRTYKTLNRNDYEEAIQQIIADIPDITVKILGGLESELPQFATHIRNQQPELEKFLNDTFLRILEKLDIPGILRGQMRDFDEIRLENMVLQATNEQLKYIQYLGAFLGIIGGLLIWQPLIMTLFFIACFLVLHSLDLLIVRLKSRTLEQK